MWLPFYFAETELPIAVSVVDWHVHELIFGVMPAIIAGFLLTAIPNWTGRLPVKGIPLLILIGIWFAGRIAFNMSSYLGLTITAFVDCAFLLTFFLQQPQLKLLQEKKLAKLACAYNYRRTNVGPHWILSRNCHDW